MNLLNMVARLARPLHGGFLPPEVNEARLDFEQRWQTDCIVLEEIDVYMGDNDPDGIAMPSALVLGLLDAQLEYISTIKGFLDDAKRYDHTSKHNAADVLIAMKHMLIDLGLDGYLFRAEAQEHKSVVELGRWLPQERIGVTVNLKEGYQCVRVWRIRSHKIVHENRLMYGWIPKGRTLLDLIREALEIAKQEITK
jgi:hypothetical protein